jgi:hypothetical protein
MVQLIAKTSWETSWDGNEIKIWAFCSFVLVYIDIPPGFVSIAMALFLYLERKFKFIFIRLLDSLRVAYFQMLL